MHAWWHQGVLWLNYNFPCTNRPQSSGTLWPVCTREIVIIDLLFRVPGRANRPRGTIRCAALARRLTWRRRPHGDEVRRTTILAHHGCQVLPFRTTTSVALECHERRAAPHFATFSKGTIDRHEQATRFQLRNPPGNHHSEALLGIGRDLRLVVSWKLDAQVAAHGLPCDVRPLRDSVSTDRQARRVDVS